MIDPMNSMASVHNHFEDRPALKRKRVNDLDLNEAHAFKRSNLTRLPIRTSPTISQNQLWQRPLTPVDSSDDESHGQADRSWISRHTSPILTKRSPTHRIPSVTVDLDAMDDGMDTFTMPISTYRTPTGFPHPRQLNLLSAPAVSLDERVPTPITSSFNLLECSPKSRMGRAIRSTMLSPMMPEEPYLPSPIEPKEMNINADPETHRRMEHASSGFGALRVDCEDDMMQDTIPNEYNDRYSTPKDSKSAGGRNARLHMGFRADCEKCQQRVPGHYSHILWS